LVAEGHVLIEDTPGTGKTSQFKFRPGPIFSAIVIADKINRTSPKTQSALLETMAEGQVTIEGHTHRLDRPFMVLATQNPLDHEGTYPLPEGQLDRFLMKGTMGYPSHEAELKILTTHATVSTVETLQPVITREDVQAMSAAAATVHVAEPVQRYLVDLAVASRSHRDLALAMSPRAILALQQVSRALATAQGRDFVTPDDVRALAHPTLDHRLVLNADVSLRGVRQRDVRDDILRSVSIPRLG